MIISLMDTDFSNRTNDATNVVTQNIHFSDKNTTRSDQGRSSHMKMMSGSVGRLKQDSFNYSGQQMCIR